MKKTNGKFLPNVAMRLNKYQANNSQVKKDSDRDSVAVQMNVRNIRNASKNRKLMLEMINDLKAREEAGRAKFEKPTGRFEGQAKRKMGGATKKKK